LQACNKTDQSVPIKYDTEKYVPTLGFEVKIVPYELISVRFYDYGAKYFDMTFFNNKAHVAIVMFKHEIDLQSRWLNIVKNNNIPYIVVAKSHNENAFNINLSNIHVESSLVYNPDTSSLFTRDSLYMPIDFLVETFFKKN
jgi:hypothetical protein